MTEEERDILLNARKSETNFEFSNGLKLNLGDEVQVMFPSGGPRFAVFRGITGDGWIAVLVEGETSVTAVPIQDVRKKARIA